jgi:hypothetical protein
MMYDPVSGTVINFAEMKADLLRLRNEREAARKQEAEDVINDTLDKITTGVDIFA